VEHSPAQAFHFLLCNLPIRPLTRSLPLAGIKATTTILVRYKKEYYRNKYEQCACRTAQNHDSHPPDHNLDQKLREVPATTLAHASEQKSTSKPQFKMAGLTQSRKSRARHDEVRFAAEAGHRLTNLSVHARESLTPPALARAQA
jgi:hypothetical protein